MARVRGPSSSPLAAGDGVHVVIVAGSCGWWTRPGVVLVAIVHDARGGMRIIHGTNGKNVNSICTTGSAHLS